MIGWLILINQSLLIIFIDYLLIELISGSNLLGIGTYMLFK